jgi:hypothetical protein
MLPKFTGEAVRVTPGGGVVPVPVSVTVWGLPEPLSAIFSVADSAAVVEGVKVTLIVQVPPAASVGGAVGHVVLWTAKSEGLLPMKVIVMPVSELEVALASVTTCEALVVPLG